MKLYDVELREKSVDTYIYNVIDRNLVSESFLIQTINGFLSTREDGKAYVVISQVEAKV
jgi:hypothetical protein